MEKKATEVKWVKYRDLTTKQRKEIRKSWIDMYNVQFGNSTACFVDGQIEVLGIDNLDWGQE